MVKSLQPECLEGVSPEKGPNAALRAQKISPLTMFIPGCLFMKTEPSLWLKNNLLQSNHKNLTVLSLIQSAT